MQRDSGSGEKKVFDFHVDREASRGQGVCPYILGVVEACFTSKKY